MARSGKGSRGGFVADNVDRVGSAGKDGMVIETVQVAPSSSLVTIYNRNATKYYGGQTANEDLFTTGAAIVSDVMNAKAFIPVLLLATGAFTTTTESRPLTCKIINGPTTLGKVFVPGSLSGSLVSVTILGKTF